MTTTLTNEDKLGIVMQHIKNIDYSIYAAELDLIQAQAVSQVDVDLVASANSKITALTAKRAALVSEQASLTE